MAHTHRLPSRAPVVVVGAGYAGLSAALALHDNGITPLVLEAAGRVGGRVRSERTEGGVIVDHGGQWIGPTQRRAHALIDRFGCTVFPTWDEGATLERWPDGTVRRYTGAEPEDFPGVPAYRKAIERIDELARRVDPRQPWACPESSTWDSETVHTYLERAVPCADARRRLRLAVHGVWAVEPRDISLLHFLFYVASAGGFRQLMETRAAAQESRFVAGAQAPALAVAEHLGGSVVLDARVEAVEWTRGVVHSSAGTVHAERVIVATPPAVTTGIDFRPMLPLPRQRWVQRSTMGDVAKIHVLYSRPFWRDRGLSGIASLYGDHAVGVVFDNSPPEPGHGVLVAFVYADHLRRWSARSARDRHAEVLRALTELFGPDAADPVDYVEKCWPEDPWARGGYSAHPSPGTWVAHGAAGWRTPCGRLHWAGTETASVWNGYIDGAISSGERAAAEVLAVPR